jgi:transposase
MLEDREYIGQECFKTLSKASIDWVIRLRAGNYQKEVGQGGKPGSKLEKKAKAHLGRIVWQAVELKGNSYYFVLMAHRSRTGKVELLRLITTLTPQKAVKYYQYQYRIEPLFRHFKSNGSDLESIHVQKAYKLQLLMTALVLAYTLAVVYGLKKFQHAIQLKKHGAWEMSLFRWDWTNGKTIYPLWYFF